MRTTQFIGLSSNAWDYIKANVSVVKKYFPMVEARLEKIMKEKTHIDSDNSDFIEGFYAAIEEFSPTEYSQDQLSPVTGMFDEDVHILKRYYLKQGGYVDEYVQAEPWSSGPVIFLALMDSNGQPIPETLWSQEEINNA